MKRMTISILRHGMNIFYKCYNGVLRYGKKCPDRDNGHNCMICKYCKAEMGAYDATRLLESYGHRME